MLPKWQILSTLTQSPFLCKKVLYIYFVIHVLEEKAPTVACDSCVRATARCSEIWDKRFEGIEMTAEVQEKNNKLWIAENTSQKL